MLSFPKSGWASSLLAVLVALSAFSVRAQECRELTTFDDRASQPRFVVVAEQGVIIQLDARLMWYRCAFGQTYDRGQQRCAGAPFFGDFLEALEGLDTFDHLGYSDWTLPSHAELRGMLLKNCVQPSVDTEVFASVISDRHWTGTYDYVDPYRVQAIDLSDGHNAYIFQRINAYARVVRRMSDYELEHWSALSEATNPVPQSTLYGARLANGEIEEIDRATLNFVGR